MGNKSIPVGDEQEPERPLNCCPKCGEDTIVVFCEVLVGYDVKNYPDSQQWERFEVFDDDSYPDHFKCGSCGTLFYNFRLNDEGYLVWLGER